jgi:hypothetical protein
LLLRLRPTGGKTHKLSDIEILGEPIKRLILAKTPLNPAHGDWTHKDV